MLTLRSSCGFGRIEIRSSSEESQFIAFIARSLFPLKERKEFATHEELPTTTKRPSEFSLPVLYVPAAAIVIGPFLLEGSFGLMLGVSSFDVARLASEDSKSFCTVDLSVFLISRDRDKGNPVAEPFISFTIGCGSDVETSAIVGPTPSNWPTGLRSSSRSLSIVTPQLSSIVFSASLSAVGRPIFSGGSSRNMARPPSSTY